MKAQQEETLRVPSACDEQRSVWDGCIFYLRQSEQKHVMSTPYIYSYALFVPFFEMGHNCV